MARTQPLLPRLMLAALGSVLLQVGCASDVPTQVDPTDPDLSNTAAGEDNTFSHEDIVPDIWELLERLKEEGPPEYTSRVHSCPKIRYQTIGQMLSSLGVDLAATEALSAGRIYSTSSQALGAPNYGARSRENLGLTTASAAKLFDIFSQAAPEIIAAMPTLERCMVGDVGTEMFNASNQCNAAGITCLIGVPATAGHVEICNLTVTEASDIELGKQMAVALLAAAAHTCE